MVDPGAIIVNRCISVNYGYLQEVDRKFFPSSFSTRFPPASPFLPLISAPTCSLAWGLVTKGAQLLIT